MFKMPKLKYNFIDLGIGKILSNTKGSNKSVTERRLNSIRNPTFNKPQKEKILWNKINFSNFETAKDIKVDKKGKSMAWDIDAAKKQGSYIVNMGPDDYLERTNLRLDNLPQFMERYHDKKLDKMMPISQLGSYIKDPFVKVDLPMVGSPFGWEHEGRHRALAAKQIGQTNIPVIVPRPLAQKEQIVEEFIKRKYPDDINTGYGDEWRGRFKKDFPEERMDTSSRKVYSDIIKEKGFESPYKDETTNNSLQTIRYKNFSFKQKLPSVTTQKEEEFVFDTDTGGMLPISEMIKRKKTGERFIDDDYSSASKSIFSIDKISNNVIPGYQGPIFTGNASLKSAPIPQPPKQFTQQTAVMPQRQSTISRSQPISKGIQELKPLNTSLLPQQITGKQYTLQENRNPLIERALLTGGLKTTGANRMIEPIFTNPPSPITAPTFANTPMQTKLILQQRELDNLYRTTPTITQQGTYNLQTRNPVNYYTSGGYYTPGGRTKELEQGLAYGSFKGNIGTNLRIYSPPRNNQPQLDNSLNKRKTMQKQQSQHTQYRGKLHLGMLAPKNSGDMMRMNLAMRKESDEDIEKHEREYWKVINQQRPISKEIGDIPKLTKDDLFEIKTEKVFPEGYTERKVFIKNVLEPVDINVPIRQPKERKEYKFIPNKKEIKKMEQEMEGEEDIDNDDTTGNDKTFEEIYEETSILDKPLAKLTATEREKYRLRLNPEMRKLYRERERKWRAEHPEQVKEYRRRWQTEHPEKVKEYNKEYKRRQYKQEMEEEDVDIDDTSNSTIPFNQAKKITMYHGSQERFLNEIKKKGLRKRTFLTPYKSTALMYANYGPEEKNEDISEYVDKIPINDDAIILEVHTTPEVTGEIYSKEGDYEINKKIPFKNIKVIDYNKFKRKTFKENTLLKDITDKTAYKEEEEKQNKNIQEGLQKITNNKIEQQPNIDITSNQKILLANYKKGDILVNIIKEPINQLGFNYPKRKAQIYYTKEGVGTIKGGYWMDTPEKHLPENYYQLSEKERALIEAKEQAEKYGDETFKFNYVMKKNPLFHQNSPPKVRQLIGKPGYREEYNKYLEEEYNKEYNKYLKQKSKPNEDDISNDVAVTDNVGKNYIYLMKKPKSNTEMYVTDKDKNIYIDKIRPYITPEHIAKITAHEELHHAIIDAAGFDATDKLDNIQGLDIWVNKKLVNPNTSKEIFITKKQKDNEVQKEILNNPNISDYEKKSIIKLYTKELKKPENDVKKDDTSNQKIVGYADGKPVIKLSPGIYPSIGTLNNIYKKLPDDRKVPIVLESRKKYLEEYIANQERLKGMKFSKEQKQQYLKEEGEKLKPVTARFTTYHNPWIPVRVVLFPGKKKKEMIKNDVLHEFGHELQEKHPNLWKKWKKTINPRTAPTLYGTTKKDEDFAESYVLYNNSKLQPITNPNSSRSSVNQRLSLFKQYGIGRDNVSNNDSKPEIDYVKAGIKPVAQIGKHTNLNKLKQYAQQQGLYVEEHGVDGGAYVTRDKNEPQLINLRQLDNERLSNPNKLTSEQLFIKDSEIAGRAFGYPVQAITRHSKTYSTPKGVFEDRMNYELQGKNTKDLDYLEFIPYDMNYDDAQKLALERKNSTKNLPMPKQHVINWLVEKKRQNPNLSYEQLENEWLKIPLTERRNLLKKEYGDIYKDFIFPIKTEKERKLHFNKLNLINDTTSNDFNDYDVTSAIYKQNDDILEALSAKKIHDKNWDYIYQPDVSKSIELTPDITNTSIEVENDKTSNNNSKPEIEDTYYRAMKTKIDKDILTPRLVESEAIDKDGNMILEGIDQDAISPVRKESVQSSFSKTPGGALIGAIANGAENTGHGFDAGKFYIYATKQKPDIDISRVGFGDFPILEEVRFTKPVKVDYVDEFNVTPALASKIAKHYHTVAEDNSEKDFNSLLKLRDKLNKIYSPTIDTTSNDFNDYDVTSAIYKQNDDILEAISAKKIHDKNWDYIYQPDVSKSIELTPDITNTSIEEENIILPQTDIISNNYLAEQYSNLRTFPFDVQGGSWHQPTSSSFKKKDIDVTPIQAGLPSTGEPRIGHSPPVRLSSDVFGKNNEEVNEEERKEYMRKWQAEHPEQVREATRRWRTKHLEQAREITRKWQTEYPEKSKEATRRWQEKHLEQVREVTRKWRAEHPEQVKEYKRKWKAEHPEKVREYARRIQQKRKNIGNITLIKYQNGEPVQVYQDTGKLKIDNTTNNSQIYLYPHYKKDPRVEAFTLGEYQNEIFINKIPNYYTPEDVAGVIAHEELHNVLQKTAGDKASRGLDKIQDGTIVDTENRRILMPNLRKQFIIPSKRREQFQNFVQSKNLTKEQFKNLPKKEMYQYLEEYDDTLKRDDIVKNKFGDFKSNEKKYYLYHGTGVKNLENIKKEGILPGNQVNKSNYAISDPNFVYLTPDKYQAKSFAAEAYITKRIISEQNPITKKPTVTKVKEFLNENPIVLKVQLTPEEAKKGMERKNNLNFPFYNEILVPKVTPENILGIVSKKEINKHFARRDFASQYDYEQKMKQGKGMKRLFVNNTLNRDDTRLSPTTDKTTKDSQIHLMKYYDPDLGMTMLFVPGKSDKIYINEMKDLKDTPTNIKVISDMLEHEEIHNLLDKKFGKYTTTAFDSKTMPMVYKRNKLLNPISSGKIYSTFKEKQDALRQELNQHNDLSEKVKKRHVKDLYYYQRGIQNRLQGQHTPIHKKELKNLGLNEKQFLIKPTIDNTSHSGGNLFWNELAQHNINIAGLTPRERHIIRRTYEKNPELLNKSINLTIIPIDKEVPYAAKILSGVSSEDALKFAHPIKRQDDAVAINARLFTSIAPSIAASENPKSDILGSTLRHELGHRDDKYNPKYIRQEEKEKKSYDKYIEQRDRAVLTSYLLSNKQKKEGNEYLHKMWASQPSEQRALQAEQVPRERDIHVSPQYAAKQFSAFYQNIDEDKQSNSNKSIQNAPVVTLYHGTPEKNISSILTYGLIPGQPKNFKESRKGQLYFTHSITEAQLAMPRFKLHEPENLKNQRILRVTIPQEEYKKGVQRADRRGMHEGEIVLTKMISPKHIKLLTKPEQYRRFAAENKPSPNPGAANLFIDPIIFDSDYEQSHETTPQEMEENKEKGMQLIFDNQSNNTVPFEKAKKLTVYHGTQKGNIEGIKDEGLLGRRELMKRYYENMDYDTKKEFDIKNFIDFFNIHDDQGITKGVSLTPHKTTAIYHAMHGPEIGSSGNMQGDDLSGVKDKNKLQDIAIVAVTLPRKSLSPAYESTIVPNTYEVTYRQKIPSNKLKFINPVKAYVKSIWKENPSSTLDGDVPDWKEQNKEIKENNQKEQNKEIEEGMKLIFDKQSNNSEGSFWGE